MCCMTYFRETFLSDQENSLFGGETPSQPAHGFLTAWCVLDRSDTDRTQSHIQSQGSRYPGTYFIFIMTLKCRI